MISHLRHYEIFLLMEAIEEVSTAHNLDSVMRLPGQDATR
jgi:hypothetical protein